MIFAMPIAPAIASELLADHPSLANSSSIDIVGGILIISVIPRVKHHIAPP
jgi:hypothetical protein